MPGLGRAGSNPAFDTSKFKRGLRLSLFRFCEVFVPQGEPFARGLIFFESIRLSKAGFAKRLYSGWVIVLLLGLKLSRGKGCRHFLFVV